MWCYWAAPTSDASRCGSIRTEGFPGGCDWYSGRAWWCWLTLVLHLFSFFILRQFIDKNGNGFPGLMRLRSMQVRYRGRPFSSTTTSVTPIKVALNSDMKACCSFFEWFSSSQGLVNPKSCTTWGPSPTSLGLLWCLYCENLLCGL